MAPGGSAAGDGALFAAFDRRLFAFLASFAAAPAAAAPLPPAAAAAIAAALDGALCGTAPGGPAGPDADARRLRLFGAPDVADAELPPEYRKTQMGKACGHVFKRGEAVWRCRTCALDDTCVFCSRCFHNSNHEGHETSFSITSGNGGCCDCGDKEAWRLDSGCKYHSAAPSDAPAGPAAPLPSDLAASIGSTVATVLDFLLFALAKAPLHPCPLPATADDIAAMPYGSEPPSKFALVLWNDELHSFDNVIDVLAKHVTGGNRAEAKRTAEAVDARGRAVVLVSDDAAQLLRTANRIAADSSHGLGILGTAITLRRPPLVLTVQPLSQTVHEEVAHACADWLHALCRRIADPAGEEAARKAVCRELGAGRWRVPSGLARDGPPRDVTEEEMVAGFVAFAEEPEPPPRPPRPAPAPRPPRPANDNEIPDLEDIDSDSGSSDGGWGPPPAQPAAPAQPAQAPPPGNNDELPPLEGIEDTDEEDEEHEEDDDYVPSGQEDEEMEVDEEGSDGEDEDFEDDEGSEDGGAGGGLPVLALEDVQGLVALAGQAGAAGLLPPGMQEILAGAAAQAGMGFDSDDEGMEGEAELQMMQEAAMDLDAAFPPGGPGSGAGEAGAAQPAGTPPKEEPVAVAVQEQEQPASPSPPGPLSADVGSLEVPDFEPPPPPPFGSEPPRSRLDMLLEWDLKQWKQLRSLLRELYIGTFVVTGDEYKAMLGLKYAANYVVTGPSYVLLDREAPLSVFLLAVQLFTVPTVAQKVMQHPTRNFFAEFLTLLKSIYLCNLPTSGITMEKFRQIYLRTWQAHPDSYSPHQLALKMDQNRTRGVGHLFLNVRYLLAAAPQAFGAGYVANMQWLLSTLTPWQGMNPQKRAAVMHVEFENDWADSVTAARNAAELIQVAAHCFAPASDGEPGTTKLDPFAPDSWRVMLHAVRFAYTAAYRWCQAENPRDPLASDQPRVLESTMSFLHPLHWMLAQLLAKMQQIAALRSARGAKPGALGIGAETEPEGRLRVWKQVFDLEAAPGTEVPRIKLMNLQRVVLKPVRVQAFVAQIRANLWVRNGDAMRMQAFHYKYESLRELGYDQDLTVIQAALCVMEPEGVLQTMANAFNLDWWLRGRSATSARLHGMEPRQMNVLAEEFMELLIFLLTERTAAAALSYEEVARREIRHHLAFQPNGMTYSALVKRVSDRATESATDENLEPQFERILKSMARFKEPDATREYGVYELHDGEFDAVDPWFWHYSRNHRAEVAEILKKRASAKKGIHVPALLPVPPNTPFSHLADLVHDKHFASVMFFTIWNCTKRADAKVRVAKDVKTWSAEDIRECGHSSGILDASLHLLLVACQEEVEGYASSVSRRRGINARKAGFMANATSCEFEVPLPTGDKLVKKTLLSLLLELIEAFGGGVTLSGSTKLKAKEASAGFVEESTVADFVPRMYWIVQRIEEWGSDEARTAVAEWRIRVVESQEDRGGADEKPKELTDVDKKRQAAKDRQAAIMAQMKAQQQQFMVSHGFGGPESEEEDDDMDLQADDGAPAEDSLRERAWRFPAGTCIVCQEDADKGSELYGMLAFAQSSRLVRPLNPAEPDEATAALAGVVHLPSSLDEDAGPASGSNLSKEYLARQTFGARADICVSTCGHIMHSKCFTSFMQSVTQRLTQHRERNHPEQGPKDFMCPMCKSLGNMLLPVVASVKTEKVNVVADDSKGAAHSKGKEDHVGQFTTWSQGVVHQRDFLGKLRSGAASPRMDAGPPTTRARAARAGSSSGSSAGPLASSPPTLGFRELFGRALGQIIPGLFRGSRAESGAGDGAPAESKGEALRFAYNARVVNVLKDIKAKIRILPRTADTMDLMETLWSCFAYTVKCYETAARGTGRAAGEPLWHRGQPSIWVSQLSANQVTLLRLLGETILGYANMLMTDDDPNVSTEPEVVEAQMRERSAALVGAIFAGIIAKPSLPAEPLLLRDGLDIFAEVSSTVIPATANPLSEDDDMWQWTRLIYLIDIVRTAANIAHLVGDVRATLEMEGEAFDGPAFPAKDLVQWVAGLIGMSSAVTQIGSVAEASLAKLFQALLLPSLRRYALLLHARFGVVPEGQDGSTPSPVSPTASSAGHHDGEFARLTTFLRLPTLAEVCAHLLGHGSAAGEPGDPTLTRIVSSWCAHYRDWTRSPSSWTIAIADPTIPQLVALPQQLTLLIESSIAFVCGKCGTTPTDPALCLLCGQYVCSQSMCCAENRQGECNQHMQNCGGETGIFFIVKRGAILYLHRGNGTFVPMPYLDTHGESDVGLKRGRPAFFNAKRYADIRKTWLTLQIPQLIARKVESSYDVGGWGAF